MKPAMWADNSFSWCDMTNPFGNPFCPTFNPFFNILIKMMIPGIIRPLIDHWLQKFMNGYDFPIKLLACLMPPLDGAGPRGGPIFMEVETTPGRWCGCIAACFLCCETIVHDLRNNDAQTDR